MVKVGDYVAAFDLSPLAEYQELPPWRCVQQAASIVEQLLSVLPQDRYAVTNNIAIHRTATVESGAVLKGPLIIGAACFIASGAYLRGGCWIDTNCIVGPGAELKSSFMFQGSKLAHFNFVGDSILGSHVNLEAGSIICNYRNERADKEIRVCDGDSLRGTGVDKFGALIGDGARIGANAVVAPGALIARGAVLARGRVLDQEVACSAA
jgi:bifunctional N-acetylglucosamine-1-phosphate-uridyltransferase/glucosamine-1-phosphate-acetyltransferase GlmU-like protein